MDSALEVLNKEPLKGRDYANGHKMYSAGLCVACHRFGDEGGGVGPDLTNLAKRMDYKAILESTIHPNMVVSNQFEQHELTMKDGSLMIGKIVSEEDGYYSLGTVRLATAHSYQSGESQSCFQERLVAFDDARRVDQLDECGGVERLVRLLCLGGRP